MLASALNIYFNYGKPKKVRKRTLTNALNKMILAYFFKFSMCGSEKFQEM